MSMGGRRLALHGLALVALASCSEGENAGAPESSPQSSQGYLGTVVRGITQAQKLSCANNLRQLHLHLLLYRTTAGTGGRLPTATGSQLWLELHSGDAPILRGSESVFVCPAADQTPREMFTTYRGPTQDPNDLKPNDILGGCIGQHGDGSITVLKADGSVITLEKNSDPLYSTAIETTQE